MDKYVETLDALMKVKKERRSIHKAGSYPITIASISSQVKLQ